MTTAPSGEQFEIRNGSERATIVEVGGGVREYVVGQRRVLDPYPVDTMCDGAHGAPLIPWPNRLADGRYRFDGTDYGVALTEPAKHNAIHGFLRWRSWQAVVHEASRVVMATRLHPLMGYPFAVDVQVAYELVAAGGLVVATTATNVGDGACPYAAGQHPYLSPGRGRIDDCLLELGAFTRILTDNERQLPTGTAPVQGTQFDFRAPRRLGDQKLDTPFTDLDRDADGRAWARLIAPDHSCVQLWVDEHYPVIEIYTGDTLSPGRRRRGLGTEPMTSPPNAFQSGEGLIRLQAGESLTTSWGVRLDHG
ncbi:MAG TPA: aldose 1-epimerase family protein [Solirubrobacteraceae bacterium]